LSSDEQLVEYVTEIEEEKVYGLVRKMLEEGRDAKSIIELLRKGVDIIGERYNKKEYFLTELVMAGEMFQNSAKILEPALKKERKPGESLGTIVIGTVKGDVHDIGKNIFVTLLMSAGFEVHDLGVDIPPEAFVEKVKETKANIVAYSGLLTIALEGMRNTTDALTKADLRDKVKIIIGGLPIDEMWMKEAKADAFTTNAFKGVQIIKQWIKEGVV